MAKFDEYHAFITIVELNSLSKAAKSLHLSPSAISKKLSLLEASLGVQLIDRSTRSLAITDAGKSFYRDCKAILSSVMTAEERLLDSKGEPSGKLTLSCPRVLLQPSFLTLINEFCAQYPSIKISLCVSNDVEDLVSGCIDFSFRIGQLKDSRLQAAHLQETRPVFCASPHYLDQHGTPAQLTELTAHTVIIPTYLNLSDKMRQLFTGLDPVQNLLELELFHTTDDVYALYQWILQGGGISMMLDIMIDKDIANGSLQHLFPKIPFPSQKLVLLWHKKEYQSKKMSLFKEFVTAKYETY
jgi:DNA-binding transcriptional LysR family regulator